MKTQSSAKRLILLICIILFSVNKVFSQTIEIKIGEDANQVKNTIQWITQDHDQVDSYGNTSNSHWTWDVKYYNGEISEVFQCHENEYIMEWGIIANYCNRYIMKNGKLAHTLTQYADVSLEKLKSFYNSKYLYGKNSDVYFSQDYQYYSKLYLADNGYATVELKKTDQTILPKSIFTDLIKLQSDERKVEEQNAIALQKENDLQRTPDSEQQVTQTPIEDKGTEVAQAPIQDENMVFTKVDVDADFPGGQDAWVEFLNKNLDPQVPVNADAPEGTYKVVIRFIVGKDGSASDIEAETNFGYGMEEEAIRAIQKVPKWIPALQNGRNVNAYKRQTIIFHVDTTQAIILHVEKKHKKKRGILLKPLLILGILYSIDFLVTRFI